jgi:hypothetical protein
VELGFDPEKKADNEEATAKCRNVSMSLQCSAMVRGVRSRSELGSAVWSSGAVKSGEDCCKHSHHMALLRITGLPINFNLRSLAR